ncbi:MAG: hypothetical protein ACLR43_00930 [Faecalibacillus faecis]
MIEPYFNIVFNEKDMSIEDATYVSFDLKQLVFLLSMMGLQNLVQLKLKMVK